MPFKKGKTPEGATPFVSGQSGNPNGRPKGVRNRQTIVREVLEIVTKELDQITGKTKDMTQAEIMTLALAAKAKKGDVMAFKELMDSAFGQNKQVIDHTHELTSKDIIAKAFPDVDEAEAE